MKKLLLIALFSLFSLNAYGVNSSTRSNTCDYNEVEDCTTVASIFGVSCTPASWIGDNMCDPNLNCGAYYFDGGDCGECAYNEVKSCDNASCFNASWLGDGECDSVLNCERTNYDGGDCFTSISNICDYNEIEDCTGSCSPTSWVGDGECDSWLNCSTLIYDGGDCSTAMTQTTMDTSAISSCNTLGITASNSCSDKECNYSTKLTTPGFYIATVKLPSGKKEGFWGMEISTTCGVRSGFNSGAILEDDVPGFMAFYLSQAESVNITPYEYSGLGQITIQLSKRENGNETVVFGPINTSSGQSNITSVLQPGFYVAEAFSEPNVSRGRFGFEVSATSMVGGVNVGGWIDYYTGGNGEGFSGFYISESQYVGINTFFGATYGNSGADPISLEIYRKESNGDRTLVFSQ